MLAISGMVNVTDKQVEDYWDEGWIYNIPADQRALFHTLTLIR
jgi:hypothetical protein